MASLTSEKALIGQHESRRSQLATSPNDTGGNQWCCWHLEKNKGGEERKKQEQGEKHKYYAPAFTRNRTHIQNIFFR